MKELTIKRCLSEDTRIQTIHIKDECFDLHHGLGDDSKCYYITEHGNADKIYMIADKEFFENMFD
jgi:hypothetical protein